MKASPKLLWSVFGLLAIVSVGCMGYGLLVYDLTLVLVHDTLHEVGQLNDDQRNALYPALLNAYRPVLVGLALTILGWITFSAVILRSSIRK
jgi:hypothetical protein